MGENLSTMHTRGKKKLSRRFCSSKAVVFVKPWKNQQTPCYYFTIMIYLIEENLIMFKITAYPNGSLDIVDFDLETLKTHKNNKAKNCTHGQSEIYDDFKSVVRRAAEVPISPSELKDNRRVKDSLIGSNIMILDIDDNCSLKQAEELLDQSGYQYGIYTSYSHATFGRDKFHVVFPTSRIIVSDADYKSTYNFLSKNIFGEKNDTQTSSPNNLFFQSNQKTCKIIFNKVEAAKVPVMGKILFPTIIHKQISTIGGSFDKLSRRTLAFLHGGGESGKWHQELVLAIQNFKSAGFSEAQTEENLLKITGTLTPDDMYQLKYGYQNSNFIYNVDILSKEIHPLRLKYTNERGKPLLIPERELVDAFKKEYHLNIFVNGQYALSSTKRDFGYVYEEFRNFAEVELKVKVSPAIFESIMNKLVADERDKRLGEIKEGIKYHSDKFDFDKLTIAITGKSDQLVTATIKHFLWQVKRKLFNKPVKWHIMPVFVGAEASGKSELIKRMLSPINDLVYWDGDFKKLVDTREVYNLCNYYVYFIDEMSKADKADVETIKNKITSDDIQYRRLGTNTTLSAQNKATFIGAANVNIENIIKDPTSSRRFFQINTQRPMDWSFTAKFDALEMWQSINENNDADQIYIKDCMEELRAAQQSFKNKTPIEHFIKEEKLVFFEDETTRKITTKKLYEQFQAWRINNGYNYTINKHAFLENFRSILGEPRKGKVEGISTNYYNALQNKDE